MSTEGRREDEQQEQDEEKAGHIRVMNPLTLDFHVHVAATKIRTFRLFLSRCSSSDNVPSAKLNSITSAFSTSFYPCEHLLITVSIDLFCIITKKLGAEIVL